MLVENFAIDMWPRLFAGTTLERKNNNKGYSKSNCTWATKTQQARNRRTFKNSQTGVTGVIPQGTGFNARYDANGIRYDLGNFNTIEEAVKVRNRFISFYKTSNPRMYALLNRDPSKRRVGKNADRRLRRDSTTGVKGITIHPQGYVIRKTVNRKRLYLDFTATLKEAIERLRAA